MNDEKGLLGSMTIQGVALMLITPLLTAWLGGDAAVIGEEVKTVANAGGEFFGAVMVIWGRLRARSKITSVL